MASRPWSSTMRATRSSCQVARLHGRGTRQPGRECDGRDSAGARGRGSWPPAPMIPTWPGGSTVSRPSLGSSHRVREKLAARRPRVVVEEPAQSRRRVPVFGRVGPPRRHVCHDRGPGRTLCASRGAQAGGVRPPAASRCRGGGRAPLRGAASHEAEGRCGARGGGAGRVGPPTSWHRLRLLRQILDELVPGVEQWPCAPYAVLRRTRRRGDAVRGLAGCERPRGACACCAR